MTLRTLLPALLLPVAASLMAAPPALPTDSVPVHVHEADASVAFSGILQAGKSPVYPAEAARLGLQGVVWIECLVDETGQVRAPGIVSPEQPMFDTAALEAVSTWRFSAPMRGDTPTYQVVRIPIHFRLKDAPGFLAHR